MVDPLQPAELLRAALAGRDVPCTHCGHNLRDNTTGVCPECGRLLRVVVEADRLARRAWVPVAALGVLTVANGIAAVMRIQAISMMMNTVMILPGAPSATGGIPISRGRASWVPSGLWVDATVYSGVALGSLVAMVLAARAWRHQDRMGIFRALWRCMAVSVIMAAPLVYHSIASMLR